MLIEGKVALITGAARGIGKAYAEALLKKGAKVSVVDVSNQIGGATVQEFQSLFGTDRVIFIKCDVCNKEQLEGAFRKTIEQLGGLDIVVNNAGLVDGNADFQQVIDVNLTATMRGTYLAVDHMSQEKGGQGGVVINISSVIGFNTLGIVPAYTASKHAVMGFTKSYAATLGEDHSQCGVRVNMLCPARVKTDINRAFHEVIEGDACPKGLRDYFTYYGGWLSQEELALGLLRLIEEDSHHGKALLVTSAGQEFITPTKHWA